MAQEHLRILENMKKIAHRGNIDGPQPSFENKMTYLRNAYVKGYDVELDVIGHRGILYLGHDEPEAPAPTDFLQNTGVWVHAKNHEAAQILTNTRCTWFWHQEDDFALTSNGFMWCYPGVYIDHPRAIWLNFDDAPMPDTGNIYALCADRFDDSLGLTK